MPHSRYHIYGQANKIYDTNTWNAVDLQSTHNVNAILRLCW